jgi:hypothetical protein
MPANGTNRAEEEKCAATILATVMRRAYRVLLPKLT